jgi:hypothetical protein
MANRHRDISQDIHQKKKGVIYGIPKYYARSRQTASSRRNTQTRTSRCGRLIPVLGMRIEPFGSSAPAAPASHIYVLLGEAGSRTQISVPKVRIELKVHTRKAQAYHDAGSRPPAESWSARCEDPR